MAVLSNLYGNIIQSVWQIYLVRVAVTLNLCNSITLHGLHMYNFSDKGAVSKLKMWHFLVSFLAD